MKLTKKQAKDIEDSQTDLGGKSKEALVMVLTAQGEPELDSISEIIANAVIGSDTLEDAGFDLDYAINQLTMARDAITELEKEHNQ
jgi:hypothetical protein